MKYLNTFLCVLLSLLCCCNQISDSDQGIAPAKQTLFELLDSDKTGVNFSNQVTDGEHFNILTYRNYYNGGGVAIGDINNDSLPDIYLTANQHPNRLYLNQGGFVFKDITKQAGVAGKKAWSTGVTMADVNGDGLLDIYVCNSGDIQGGQKENELFINNGDLTFSERSSEYNLDNAGYSTHAAFFDYDLDGDLDCYILNNSFRDPSKIELYRKVREEANDPGGDKLMQNDNGTFRDVTVEAMIYSSDIGFGLGVALGDLNNDNLPDIYISNDFWERDYLYLNNGNGTFSEDLINRIDYCSISSMGADIADINNDGSPEIFTTDMLPADNYRLQTTMVFNPYHLEDLKYRANFHYQMIQNCLHLNDGQAGFQEVAHMSGVAATDWSWGALIFDYENDGHKDIFVSNGIVRDLMSNDFRDFLADNESRNAIVQEKGKYDQRDFISHMPSNPLSNYAFKGNSQLLFEDQASSLGLGEPSFSNGAAYADLDNDGDLDLVVNNVNQTSFIFKNHSDRDASNHYLKVSFQGYSQNPFGIGCKVTLKNAGKIWVLENYNTRGFQSSIEPSLLFGLGGAQNIEKLKVEWPDGKIEVIENLGVNQEIILAHANAKLPATLEMETPTPPIFQSVTLPSDARHKENRYNDFDREILLPYMLSTEGPRLVMGDVNGDQLQDFVLLGASGDPDKLFIQKPSGQFVRLGNLVFDQDQMFESTCGALLDYDRDGDLDLMIGSGGNQIEMDRSNFLVRLYKNNGRGVFSRSPANLPPIIGNFSTLEAADYNQDGWIDVFLGARSVPGNYGLPPRSYLLKNVNGTYLDEASPALANAGMVTDASWEDLDSDGYPELVVVGDWMSVSIFRNQKGSISDMQAIPASNGWWKRIEAADLDSDGDIDFVLGNWGLNSKFRASAGKPVTMYVNDFDQNGKSEFILNWCPPLDNQLYPFATKMELTTQLPGIQKDILKYEDYAPKTYDSLFNSQEGKEAIAYKADFLESAILWNEGNDQWNLAPLPLEAQVSPVFAIVAKDLDGDSQTDIWLGGNFYALKPQVGRHDASRGVFLKGNPGRSFVHIPPKNAGIYVTGEVRDAQVVTTTEGLKLLIARNNNTVLYFQRP